MDLDLGNTWKQRRAFKQAPFLLCAHFVNVEFLKTKKNKKTLIITESNHFLSFKYSLRLRQMLM